MQSLRSLQDLSPLAAELSARKLAEAAALKRTNAARLAAEQERRVFELTVGPVQALAGWARVTHAAKPPTPEPRQRQADERAALAQALSDDFDVDSLLETDETLSFRRVEISPEVVNKLRRGHWALQAQLDLHGLRREQAREALGRFVNHSAQHGLRCVRVIHGKGHGSPGREPVLKARVRRWLVQKREVLAFVQARASDGGSGALIVLLGRAPG